MAESPGDTQASEVIPAGHPAREHRRNDNGPPASPGVAGLGLAALGIVFGDIGTSPIYTFRECFSAAYGHGPDPAYVLGVLSLIAWALIIVVALKYVLLIMRADNHGEGGILALLALAHDAVRGERGQTILTLLGIAGASLFYGDSMITPAISVLSAIEGIGIATPALNSYILPITVAVLVALFLVQKRGTATVGYLFGPVMAIWFLIIGGAGIVEIAAAPRVLAALNPAYAADVFIAAPWTGFIVLGAVALAITGGEALYADMGHFGRFPIRLAWFAVVMPALLLNYFGQGALILSDPQALDNPFFHLAPGWALVPLVLLSTAATVIASQAVISGAFSMSRQAMQLGLMPQLDVFQTSTLTHGQIYIPQINYLLLIAVVALVLAFGSSSALAAAYGFAVTGTMAVTTILAGAVARGVWHWRWPAVLAVLAPLLAVDLALFGANTLKIPSGGWFPLVIGIVVFTVMTTWRTGRRLVLARLAEEAVPLDSFIATTAEAECETRVSGTAVFLATRTDTVPLTLRQNLRHNRVLHRSVLLVHVVTENIPYVAREKRLRVSELGHGFWRVEAHFGFAETPNVPRALQRVKLPGIDLDPVKVSFFVGRTNIKSTARPGMVRWREQLYVGLVRVATRPAEFFRIPAARVIELGAEIDI